MSETSETDDLVLPSFYNADSFFSDLRAKRQRANEIIRAGRCELSGIPEEQRNQVIARVTSAFYAELYPHSSYTPDFAEPLSWVTCDHSDKSREEIWEKAAQLMAGGEVVLLKLVEDFLPKADPRLLVAAKALAWQDGKAGFPFLPDPADLELDVYQDRVRDLVESLLEHPSNVLVGSDRAFYESLPDRFTVYRGCSGISPEMAAAGLCWTTCKDTANWFACRRCKDPVLVSARVRKEWVLFAFASEFEVVVTPPRYRSLKPIIGRPRPAMRWQG